MGGAFSALAPPPRSDLAAAALALLIRGWTFVAAFIPDV